MNRETQTSTTETIAAIATPPGKGGVGIIRVSGPAAKNIAVNMLGKLPRPRQAEFLSFCSTQGEILDQGIAIYFPAPHSFTGEDVLELQAHGGPVVLDLLLQECLSLGARMARPGEFSERAFLNDKLDLAQAEAIADLIEASSTHAARAAMRSLQGDFSRQVHELVEALTQLRMYIEAAIDFPEEEIDFLSDEKIHVRFDEIENNFNALLNSARQGSLLREGMTVVIAGRPNAGKSSLLNALAGRESAIVTEIAGTTRDVLREHIQIDGLPVHIIDTAGLRETDDQVEQIGVKKAWDEISRADRILLLVDDRTGVTVDDRQILDQLPENLPVTVIRNKCDLSHNPASLERVEGASIITLSAKEGAGIDLLRRHLEDCVGYQAGMEGEFSARRRHLDALNRAISHLENAREQLQVARAGELAAEELREAQQDLSEITGEFGSDELLGRIFTSFCIGK